MATLKAGPSKLKQWLSLLIGVIVTIIFLAWALRDVSLAAVGLALKQARWEWLLVGWLAYLTSYGFRAWRWGVLLAATCNPGRFTSRLAAIFIGFGANSVLPAYAGEFIRAGTLYQLDRVPVEAAVGSILAERLLDLGVVFLFLWLPIWLRLLPADSSLSHLPLGWIGGIIVLVWVAFIIGAGFPQRIAHLCGSVSEWCGLKRFKAGIVSITLGFLGGLSALKQLRRSLLALLITSLVWGLNAVTYWAGFIAFGLIEPGIPGSLLTQSMTALAIALPSTPGYVGPFEAGIRFALNIYHIAPGTAVAYAIALRFLMYITIPVIAAAIALKLGFFRHRTFHPFSLKLKSGGNH